LGGTTSGSARDTRPLFSMLYPPIPAIMPSMIFSSKVLFVLVVFPGRGRSGRHDRPMPSAMAASRRARVHRSRRFARSAAGFVHRFSVQMFQQAADSRRNSLLQATFSPDGPYQPDQGAFAAPTPRKESYRRAATPATMATSARFKHVPIVVFPRSAVKQGEIDHRAIGEAVDPLRRRHRCIRPSASVAIRSATLPSRSPGQHRHGLDDHQADLGDLAAVRNQPKLIPTFRPAPDRTTASPAPRRGD